MNTTRTLALTATLMLPLTATALLSACGAGDTGIDPFADLSSGASATELSSGATGRSSGASGLSSGAALSSGVLQSGTFVLQAMVGQNYYCIEFVGADAAASAQALLQSPGTSIVSSCPETGILGVCVVTDAVTGNRTAWYSVPGVTVADVETSCLQDSGTFWFDNLADAQNQPVIVATSSATGTSSAGTSAGGSSSASGTSSRAALSSGAAGGTAVDMGNGACMQYLGPDAAATAATLAGYQGTVVIDACPTAGLLGSCTETDMQTYYYTAVYGSMASLVQQSCTDAGNTWNAP